MARSVNMAERRLGKTLAVTMTAALGLALAGLAGCTMDAQHIAGALGSKSKPYKEMLEDPVTLTTIKTIAVMPFNVREQGSGFDAADFATRLANQLAAEGQVRVIYPNEIITRVRQENVTARRYNAQLRERTSLGWVKAPGEDGGDIFNANAEADEARPRRYFDPIRNVDEAVRLARLAKADAIIVGEVSDFDPYMRPRLSMTMRLVATGNTDTAAQAIAEMTQWGIPRASGSTRGTIYIRQESFDSSIGSVGMEVSKYGTTHLKPSSNPFGNEIYIQSMSSFYDVIAHQLAKSYIDARKKAIKEAMDRAKRQAKADNADQAAAMARLTALMERDSRIPDHETGTRGEDYFDQAFVSKQALLAGNGGDKRIQSWRPEGPMRQPSTGERWSRDGRIPENERGPGMEGYSAMTDSSFPDADEVMEGNIGGRDKGWRPDYYNHANPEKSAGFYDPREFRK